MEEDNVPNVEDQSEHVSVSVSEDSAATTINNDDNKVETMEDDVKKSRAVGDNSEDAPEAKEDKVEEEGDKENNMAHEMEQKNEQLKLEVEKLQRDLDNAKSEIAVSEYLQESLAQTERQKNSLQEEVATLQALLVEISEGREQESLLMKLRKKTKMLESENQDLKIQLRINEGRQRGSSNAASLKSPLGSSSNLGGTMDKDKLLGSAAVLTDKTKNMVRKMKSTVVQSFPAGPLTPEEEMKKAQDDSEVLKAIVEPLEEQIVALKGKLRETDSLLQEYEKRQATSLLEMECVGAWLNGEDRSKLEERLAVEAGDGYSEEAGQLYHAILAARIGMLTQEVELLRLEKEENVSLLEAEKRNVRELRQSLETSNTNLLSERTDRAEELTAILEILNEEQKVEIRKTTTQLRNARKSQQEQRADKQEKSPSSRIVSEAEWERLLAKLDTLMVDTGSQADTKGSSELSTDEALKLKEELKSVQKDRENLQKEREHLQNNCAKYKQDLTKEAAFRKEIEETWNSRGAEYRSQVEYLQERLKKTELGLEKLGGLYRMLQESGRRDLMRLTTDREKIVKELRRLQDENDNLVGKHSAMAEEMANEVINLPNSQEDMQYLLLTYREDLITAKIAKEAAEEKMRNEVTLMRSQVAAERQGRSVAEELFSAETKELRDRIKSLEPCSLELDVERQQRRELEAKLEEIHNKQTFTVAESTKQIEAVRSSKESADAHILHLKTKIASLQSDLDNSVAVQNDFVRLSQSLQVELEKIRQSEKELRWQHEDDVIECNSCKSGFMRKRKANCKHCGRIFCNDCLSKQVAAGPTGRKANVCDVCHTLLVQHSAPYFASEAPTGE